ncbi:MAG: hypothetical protein MOIL_00183 [Candidatus Methanolliviera sp. GoM_oil]|nr:MAG: hypothetical protein MOIL_00183 [Candidatus Methanolliviera sp. GoM_oil]
MIAWVYIIQTDLKCLNIITQISQICHQPNRNCCFSRRTSISGYKNSRIHIIIFVSFSLPLLSFKNREFLSLKIKDFQLFQTPLRIAPNSDSRIVLAPIVFECRSISTMTCWCFNSSFIGSTCLGPLVIENIS